MKLRLGSCAIVLAMLAGCATRSSMGPLADTPPAGWSASNVELLAYTLMNEHPAFKITMARKGDRYLASLHGRRWDVCIDNPTTLPAWARAAGEVLSGKVDRYIFVSTVSVSEAVVREHFPDANAIVRPAAGLTFRPLAQTVRDTLAWFDALPAERRAAPRAGLAPDKERQVLAALKA